MKTVGFMRNSQNPSKLAELTAKVSRYYSTEIIYMTPSDINIDTHTVNGKILIDDCWEDKELEIPPVIDISPYCFKRKNRVIMNYLRSHVLLSDNRRNRLNKEKLQEHLK